MDRGRALLVVLEILDHQILDADERMAGKVDDAEIQISDDGSATLDALLSGPGVLATRLGHERYGRWRERMESTLEPEGDRMTRLPLRLVRTVGEAVRMSIPSYRLASHGTERWVRAHVVSHIPGSSIEPEAEAENESGTEDG